MSDTYPTSHQVNAERLVLLGWSRAILLQLAHPLIAAGVAEHSAFRAGPFAAAARLHQTVHAMLALTFGSDAARDAALERIRAIHRRVHGNLATSTGRFDAGTPYSAEDPDLLLWVHATLLDSIPLVYGQLVTPMTAQALDAYCIEAAPIAIALGARETEVPRNWPALRAYFDRMVGSGSLAVGADARLLAAAVLRPPFGILTAPAGAVNRLVTIGLLPPSIRAEYGFAWTPADARRLESSWRWIRGARALLPRQLATWRAARRDDDWRSARRKKTSATEHTEATEK